VPTVDELFACCGPGVDLALDMADPLAAMDVDAVNVFHHRLGGHTVAAAHRRDLLAFAWGARGRSGIERAIRRGADGIFADDVGALVAAVRRAP
jgi:glycerophosphoryl diester phosphodiesterase